MLPTMLPTMLSGYWDLEEEAVWFTRAQIF